MSTIKSCYICGEKKYTPLWRKNDYDIVKCFSCGFIYVANVPNTKQLNELYLKFDYRDPITAEGRIRADAIKTLKKLSRYINEDSKLLDVGCGRGFLLDEARKYGCSVAGIDYSFETVNYAKNILRLNVKQDSIKTFYSGIKYDILLLNQVIEHLDKPHEVIQKCKELLNKNGILYVATPNIKSMLSNIQKIDFDHIIPPEHLGYYSVSTLIKLLEINNFRIIQSGSWSYPEDLAGIIKYIFKKGKKISLENENINNNYITQVEVSFNKKIKYLLFDKFFCNLFYKLLDTNYWGTNLEVISAKV